MPLDNQIENQKDICDYFKSCIKETSEEAEYELSKYISRIEMIMSCEYKFIENKFSLSEIECYKFMMKLSESWFAYEELLNVIRNNGYNLKKQNGCNSKKQKIDSIQEVLNIPKNFCDEKKPFGLAGIFDEDKIKDEYLKFALINEIDCFKKYLCLIFESKKEAAKNIQQYILYLERKSKGDQAIYLFESYNRLTATRNDVSSANIMSIAYAVRNQYVHDGEIFNSGIEDCQIKCDLLKSCYNFVVSYSMIIATQILIDHQ